MILASPILLFSLLAALVVCTVVLASVQIRGQSSKHWIVYCAVISGIAATVSLGIFSLEFKNASSVTYTNRDAMIESLMRAQSADPGTFEDKYQTTVDVKKLADTLRHEIERARETLVKLERLANSPRESARLPGVGNDALVPDRYPYSYVPGLPKGSTFVSPPSMISAIALAPEQDIRELAGNWIPFAMLSLVLFIPALVGSALSSGGWLRHSVRLIEDDDVAMATFSGAARRGSREGSHETASPTLEQATMRDPEREIRKPGKSRNESIETLMKDPEFRRKFGTLSNRLEQYVRKSVTRSGLPPLLEFKEKQ